MIVSALIKMGALEAKLPYGPARTVCFDDGILEGMSNDDKYLLFLSRMEAEVGGLLGKEGNELEALMGRTEGPLFVQRCALGDEVGGGEENVFDLTSMEEVCGLVKRFTEGAQPGRGKGVQQETDDVQPSAARSFQGDSSTDWKLCQV